MERTALIVFGTCAFWIVYVYALYPLLLLAVGAMRRRRVMAALPDDKLPSFVVLIPAYNEEKVIARKIECSLALDYPREKLDILVVSDCSSDRTDEIVRGYAERGIRFIRNEKQQGKIATLSELGAKATADIILITDANALFAPDSLRKIAAYFQDPTIGIVNGNKVLERTATMVGDGEGIYWKYETLLKEADSKVCSNAFVTGAMTAIRRELFIPVPSFLEFDHILPIHVVNQGYRVIFAPDACFEEETAVSTRAEYKVRVRNAVRGFTMVMVLRQYLSVLRHPWFTVHLFSRKVLRWLIGIPAVGLFVSNALLWDWMPFRWLFLAQCAFYFTAIVGWLLDRWRVRSAVFAVPFYFCLVNWASLVGFWRAFRGQRVAVWSTNR